MDYRSGSTKEHDVWHVDYGEGETKDHTSRDYVDYLVPGIFVQTTVFGAIGTAIGLAADVKSGLLERFLSLPMARSAVLTGRTLADLGRNVFVVVLMAGVGFAADDGS